MNTDRTSVKSIFGSSNQDDFIRQPSDDQHSKSKVILNTADNPLESVSKNKFSDIYKKLELIQTSKDDKLKGKDDNPFEPAKELISNHSSKVEGEEVEGGGDDDPFKPAKELISNHSPVDGGKMEAYFMPGVLQKQKELAEKWKPDDSVEKQFEDVNGPLKARITQALEDS